MVSLFPFAVVGGTPVPSSSQHTPLPARAIPSARLSFQHVVRFVPAFPAAAPSFPRRSGRPPLRRSRGPSIGGRPNHALQRTGTGVQAFPRSRVLRRRCLSLSLSSLGARMPVSVSGASRFQSRRFIVAVRLRSSRPLCSAGWRAVLACSAGRAFPIHARLSLAAWVSRSALTPRFFVCPCVTPVRPPRLRVGVRSRLTTRSSERRGGVRL